MASPEQSPPPAPPREACPAAEPAAPPPVGRRQALARALDALVVGTALLFAFFVASFAVRNSDFWMHLASGRLLAAGRYEWHFGEDPFAYTTSGTYWANHAWLFDRAVYGIYETFGGPALVVLKALLVTALAGLLLRIRRPGGDWGVSAACTALALLAMSPRLLLQPACVSCLLLGLTLWLLWRPFGLQAGRLYHGSRDGVRLGALLALFVAWVNLDAWFLLGPLLVALFWVGERLGGGPRRTPGWLVPAGLAVCLLSPHHLHAFTPPAELSPAVWVSGLPQDPRFRLLFLSPWQLGDYLRPEVGLNAAGLAYFALTVLGLASFLLGWSGLRDWRLPAWAGFALLAACQVRAVPFFAVVAGPVTALNVQDWLARRLAPAPAAGRGHGWGGVAVRAALLLAELTLVVLTWPGWLHALPHDAHRVAWAVQPDPSLERFAEALHRWRQDGLLPPGERVFAPHPDVSHYCAWFAPGERGFLDHRLQLFTPVVRQYEEVSRALAADPGEDGSTAGDWRQVLREHGVGVVVLYEGDQERLLAALRRLAQGPGDCALLRVDGRAVAFGWRGGGTAAARLRLDPARLAYGAAAGDDELPPAPPRGPDRPPRRPGWWERFARPAPPPAWESAAAAVYLHHFEDRAAQQREEGKARSVSRYAAGLAGLPALASGPWGTEVPLLVRLLEAPPFLPDLNDRPPALPLLTIRAARRAVAANPDDANAWLRLGQAYLTLHRLTAERLHGYSWQPLEIVRHVQAATALEHALVLEPDLEPAHEALTALYGERQFLDAALVHGRAAVRVARRGPKPGEGPDQYRDRLGEEDKRLEALEGLVRDRTKEFELRSPNLSGDPLARARLALGMGLARLALDDVLLRSPVVLFHGDGARMELELLLMLGRVEEAGGKLEDEELRASKHKLGRSHLPAPPLAGYRPAYHLPAYEWLHFYLAAARGDYGPAASSLHEVLLQLEEQERAEVRTVRANLPPILASELGLAASPEPLLPRLMVRSMREQTSTSLDDLFRLARGQGGPDADGLAPRALDPKGPASLALQRADLSTLGGLLALEQGVPATAGEYFRAALAAGGPAPFAARPLATSYQQRLGAVREGSDARGAAVSRRQREAVTERELPSRAPGGSRRR
jgi:hypothetical protein